MLSILMYNYKIIIMKLGVSFSTHDTIDAKIDFFSYELFSNLANFVCSLMPFDQYRYKHQYY